MKFEEAFVDELSKVSVAWKVQDPKLWWGHIGTKSQTAIRNRIKRAERAEALRNVIRGKGFSVPEGGSPSEDTDYRNYVRQIVANRRLPVWREKKLKSGKRRS